MLEKLMSSFNIDNDKEPECETTQQILIKNLMFKTELYDIVDNAKNNIIMIINTKDIKNKDDISYTIAFLEGAAHAICGTFKKIAETTYILASQDVDIQDRMCE